MNEQQIETQQPMPPIPFTRRFAPALWCTVIGGLIGLITSIANGQAEYGGIMGAAIGAVCGWYVGPESMDWFNAHITLPERLHRRIRPSKYVAVEREEEDALMSMPPLSTSTRTAILADPPTQTVLLSDPLDDEDETGDEGKLPDEEEFFSEIVLNKEPPFPRLTQAQVLAHSTRNDFTLWIGQSVKKQPRYVKKINFRKRHWKAIGGTQGGKSTLTAYMLDTIFKTHDTEHVQAVILDLEDRTGKLFEDDPHIASIMRNGKEVKLHARNVKEVFEYLGYVYTIMVERYKLPLEECEKLPVLLVYFEEFKAFKMKLKEAMNRGTAEQREQAKRDYLTFMNRFQQIVQQGLKVYVQLIVCSQVEYRDEDLVDAFANLLHGFAFCIKPTAAAAAGFLQNGLLTENARAKLQGQCVMEFPEGDDIILVPEFDIIELALAKQQPQKKTSFLIEINDGERQSGHKDADASPPLPSYAVYRDTDEEGETSDLLTRALEAWDNGYRTIDALAMRLEISPWNARPLYARVKLQRPSQDKIETSS